MTLAHLKYFDITICDLLYLRLHFIGTTLVRLIALMLNGEIILELFYEAPSAIC